MTEFVKDRTGLDGRIGTNLFTSIAKWTGFYAEPWVRALQGTEFSKADRNDLIETFKYLEFCLTQVSSGGEQGCRNRICGYALCGRKCAVVCA